MLVPKEPRLAKATFCKKREQNQSEKCQYIKKIVNTYGQTDLKIIFLWSNLDIPLLTKRVDYAPNLSPGAS